MGLRADPPAGSLLAPAPPHPPGVVTATLRTGCPRIVRTPSPPTAHARARRSAGVLLPARPARAGAVPPMVGAAERSVSGGIGGVSVVGCPFRVDRLAGVDTVGCDRRRLQLADQMLAAREHIQPGCPADAVRDRRPRWCDPARLDVQQLAQAQIAGCAIVIRRGEADPEVCILGCDRRRIPEPGHHPVPGEDRRIRPAGVQGSRDHRGRE
jgi:hypothetical protein